MMWIPKTESFAGQKVAFKVSVCYDKVTRFYMKTENKKGE